MEHSDGQAWVVVSTLEQKDQPHQNYMDTELWEGEGCRPHKNSEAHREMDAGEGEKP